MSLAGAASLGHSDADDTTSTPGLPVAHLSTGSFGQIRSSPTHRQTLFVDATLQHTTTLHPRQAYCACRGEGAASDATAELSLGENKALLLFSLLVLVFLSLSDGVNAAAFHNKTSSHSETISYSTTEEVTGSQSESGERTLTETGTRSATLTLTDTATVTGEATQSFGTESSTMTETLSPSETISSTSSLSETFTGTFSVSDEGTATFGTATFSADRTSSESATVTLSLSASNTLTLSETESGTLSESFSISSESTASGSTTRSLSTTGEVTMTSSSSLPLTDTAPLTLSETLTESLSVTAEATTSSSLSDERSSGTVSESATGSLSFTGEATMTESLVPTLTTSLTTTTSHTLSDSGEGTASNSISGEVTQSVSHSLTVSLSESESSSVSISGEPTTTVTGSGTLALTPTESLVPTESVSWSTSFSGEATQSESRSVTVSASITNEATLSESPTQTLQLTPSDSLVATDTISLSISQSSSDDPTQSVTLTGENTASWSTSGTFSTTEEVTLSQSGSISSEATVSKSDSLILTLTASESASASLSISGEPTSSISVTSEATMSLSVSGEWSASSSHSVSGELTASLTTPPTRSPTHIATETHGFTLTANGTSFTETASFSSDPTSSLTESISVTLTEPPPRTGTRTDTETPTVTASFTDEGTATPSVLSTLILTDTGSLTLTLSTSLTVTNEATMSVSQTLSGPTESVSFTSEATASFRTHSLSASTTWDLTESPTITGEGTLSGSMSESTTLTVSETTSLTLAITESVSGEPTMSFSLSITDPITESHRITETATVTDDHTTSASLSGELTLSRSRSISKTFGSPTFTSEMTLSRSESSEVTLSRTTTLSASDSASHSESASGPTFSADPTMSFSETVSMSASGPTVTFDETLSFSHSGSISGTVSAAAISITDSVSDEVTLSFSRSFSLSKTQSLTLSPSESSTVSGEDTMSNTWGTYTGSDTGTHPRTLSRFTDTFSVSGSESFSSEVTATGTVSLTGSESFSGEPTQSSTHPTPTLPPTPSRPLTGSRTISYSLSESFSTSSDPTQSFTVTLSGTMSTPPTETHEITLSVSLPLTATVSLPVTVSASISGEGSQSFSHSRTLTNTGSQTNSGATATQSRSPGTASFSNDHTQSPSITWDVTYTGTPSEESTVSVSPSGEASESRSPSTTVTMSETLSGTGSPGTRSITDDGTLTDTVTEEPTDTESETLTATLHFTSKTQTESPSGEETLTESQSGERTYSVGTETMTTTLTKSPSSTQSFTGSVSGESTESRTRTLSLPLTTTRSVSGSETITVSKELPLTPTHTFSETITEESTASKSYATLTQTSSAWLTHSASLQATPTPTMTISWDETQSASISPDPSMSLSLTISGEPTVSPFSGTQSGTFTLSGEETLTATTTPEETYTGSQTLTMTSTISPPPTPTLSSTLSPIPTATLTFSITADLTLTRSGGTPSASITSDHTMSVSLTRTDSLSLSFTLSFTSESTLTASESEDITSSVSVSPSGSESESVTGEATQSFTKSLPVPPTGTHTSSASDEGSRSFSLSFTSEQTLSESASVTSDLTTTVSGTVSDSRTETRTMSLSASESHSWSIKTITDTARYTTRPHSFTNTFPVSRQLIINIHHVHFHFGKDFAGLVLQGENCTNSTTGQRSESMLPLKYAGRLTPQTPMWEQNWTVTVEQPGFYVICYFNSAESHWYTIARPRPLTFVPFLNQEFTAPGLQLGPGNVFDFRFHVRGVNFTADDVRFVRFPADCNDPVNRFFMPLSGFWDPVTSFAHINNAASLRDSGLYVACYRGFPHLPTTPYTRITRRFIAIEGRAVSMRIVEGAPLRVRRPATFRINGHGLSVWDHFFATNDTTHRCAITSSDDPSKRIITYGLINRIQPPFPSLTGLTQLDVSIPLHAPGRNVLCHRSNTSRVFRVIDTVTVAPILPHYFTPNGSALRWAAGSDAVLSFVGDGLDTEYDIAELHFGKATCASVAGPVVRMVMFNNGTSARDTMIGRLPRAGNYSVCYRSNVTHFIHLGFITVKEQFYSFDDGVRADEDDLFDNPRVPSVFYDGADMGVPFNVDVDVVGLMTLWDRVYLSRFNSTDPAATCAPRVPRLGAILPAARHSNRTLVFNVTQRGFWSVCYITNTDAVLRSEHFAVFPDPPRAFSPENVPLGSELSTTIVFSGSAGMDLAPSTLDRDRIEPCDADSTSVSLTPIPDASMAVTATGTSLGNFTLCFTSGIASPFNMVPLRVVIPGILKVVPVVKNAVVTPRAIPIEGTVNVTLTGNGLSPHDVLYVCNATNTSQPPSMVVNTTSITLFRRSIFEWQIRFRTAGVFPLCYRYAANPSLLPGPLIGNVAAFVDPSVLTFFPRTIFASLVQRVNISGLEVEKVTRLFSRTNSTDCNGQRSPFDIDFVRTNDVDDDETMSSYIIEVNVRGTFPVCFEGPSGTIYQVPGGNRLTVQPRVDTFSASQDSVPTTNLSSMIFYDGYPIDVTLEGGALEYERDIFYAVSGSSCEVNDPLVLTALNPPLIPVDRITLAFVAPIANNYRICHRLSRAARGTIIPGLVIRVISSLVYSNRTLSVRGPAMTSNVLYEFMFTMNAASFRAPSTRWTPFQRPDTDTAISVPYIPIGSFYFGCVVLSANGNTLRTLYLPHTGVADVSVCANFPQSLLNTDTTRQFAMSVVALQNFNEMQCAAALGSSNPLDARSLLNELTGVIGADETLVKDPRFTFGAIGGALEGLQRSTPLVAADAERLLGGTAGTLSRPNSEISKELLDAHIELANIVASIAGESLQSLDTRDGQRLGLKAMERFNAIGARFCESSDAAVASAPQFNSTREDITVTVKRAVIGSSNGFSDTLNCGFGIRVTPHFQQTVSGQKCLQGMGVRSNFLPQRTPRTSQRRFDAQQQEPVRIPDTIPEFNFPIFIFSLPREVAADPLQQLRTVQFQYQFPPVARLPEDKGSGVSVEARFFRFVPDGEQSGAGEWQTAPTARATADESSSVITIDFNASTSHTPSTITPSNFIILSGTYVVTPNVLLPPDRRRDLRLAILMGGLVVLHLVMCIIGVIFDSIRDSRKNPDPSVVTKPPNNITFHHVLNMGTRKPHHPIKTPIRVTTYFTFVFAASLFTLLVVEYVPTVHEQYMNVPYGLAVALLASPFSAIVRFTAQKAMRDYASGTAATWGIVAIGVAVPLANPLVAAAACGTAGMVFFLVAVGYFRSRWSIELQPSQGPFSTVVGMCTHTLVEILAVAYVVYNALWVGIKIHTQQEWDYWVILAWALVVDGLVLEPPKNRIILMLRRLVVDYDTKQDAVKALRAMRIAAGAPTAGAAGLYRGGKALPPAGSSDDGDGTNEGVEEYHLDDSLDGDMAFVDVIDGDDDEDGSRSDEGKRSLSEMFRSLGSDGRDSLADFESVDAGVNDPFQSSMTASEGSFRADQQDDLASTVDFGAEDNGAFGPDPWTSYVRRGNLEDIFSTPAAQQQIREQRTAPSVASGGAATSYGHRNPIQSRMSGVDEL